jgi:hypothetical protein
LGFEKKKTIVVTSFGRGDEYDSNFRKIRKPKYLGTFLFLDYKFR